MNSFHEFRKRNKTKVSHKSRKPHNPIINEKGVECGTCGEKVKCLTVSECCISCESFLYLRAA